MMMNLESRDRKSKIIALMIFILLISISYGCNHSSYTVTTGEDVDGYSFSVSQKAEFENLVVKIYHLENCK